MTATLKLRDENGNVHEVPALVGKKGDKGDKGEPGKDGYTPIKRIDYMTAEDINEIQEGLELDVEIEAATIEEIQRLF